MIFKKTIHKQIFAAAMLAVFLSLPGSKPALASNSTQIIFSLNNSEDKTNIANAYHLQKLRKLYSNLTLGNIFVAEASDLDLNKLKADPRLKYAEADIAVSAAELTTVPQ